MKKVYQCIIVDDEPLAIDVIANYVNRLPQFNVLSTFTDPLVAHSELKAQPVDLLFIDIEMPDFNGLDFIKSLTHKPQVIITTAFREFAVDGFDLNILDYLVKPIEFERFMKTIDRFLETRDSKVTEDVGFRMVRSERKFVKVKLTDILYIEGVKDYIKIFLTDREILTKESIGKFNDDLPQEDFLRVHKSFIVARDKITAYTHHDVEVERAEIPIGRVYKDKVLSELGLK